MSEPQVRFLDDLSEEFARVRAERDDRALRPRGRNVNRLLPVAGVAAATALAVIALVTGGPGGSDRAEGQAVDPETRALLGVFRDERVPADEMPGDEMGNLDASHDGQPGEDPTQSRRVDLPGGPAYIWPKQDGVCVTWGNCVGTDVIREHGVAVSTSMGVVRGTVVDATVSGIARDGIETVVIVFGDGEEETVRVEDNLFSFQAGDRAPQEVRWTDSRGTHKQRIGGLGRGLGDG